MIWGLLATITIPPPSPLGESGGGTAPDRGSLWSGPGGLLDGGEQPGAALRSDKCPELDCFGAAFRVALHHRAVGQAPGHVHQREAHGDGGVFTRALAPLFGQ